MLAAVVGSALPGARLSAQAAPPVDSHRVLLMADNPSDGFVGRIRNELASMGLEVVLQAPRASLETSARAEHAIVAVRMLPSRKGIEVWMAATSGRSLVRQQIIDEAPGGPNQNVVALQMAELLRTSLFPHAPEPPPPVPSPPVLVTVQAPPPRSSGDSGLAGSLGLLYGAGGAAPAWQAWLSYRYLWNRGLGAAFTVSAPLRRGTMTGPEGAAEVGALVAGPDVFARFESPDGRLVLTTGLGAALVAVLAKGHPIPAAGAQLVSNASTAYTGLGYACVALAWKVSSWFAVGAGGLAGATTARVRVRFAGNDAGDWGPVVLGATVFGEVDWR